MHSQKTQQEILYLVQCHWFSSVSNLTTKETTFKKKKKKEKKATNFPEKGLLPTVNGGRVLKNTVITAIK